jgi:SAM-dependent methyltransferase
VKAEFDGYAQQYEALLKDPIRDRFARNSEFFHLRKWFLLRKLLQGQRRCASQLAWLDVGCGKGELLRCGLGQFAAVAGCDPSEEMLRECRDLPVQLQRDPGTLPFADASFDLVTAACVYHHLGPQQQQALTRDARRVLRPGGLFAIFEHNPRNPATRLIVSRTPVDANAVLLTAAAVRWTLRVAGISPVKTVYYLFLPQALFGHLGFVENLLGSVPFGGQYAVMGQVVR